MKNLIGIVFVLVLLLVSPAYMKQRRLTLEGSRFERRVALVIGNSAYPTAPLKNPVNDAQDMVQALRGLGFDVIYRENQNQNDMKRAIRDFGVKIRGGGVGLFYYAGHGVQVKGVNYLVPVDAKIEGEGEVEYECVDAGFVLAQMENAGNSINIIILDACRNNPFARSFRSDSRGLAPMFAPSGALIAYSTAPGSVASDGNARNGIYTQELLKVIQTPNLGIEDVFKRVRVSVRNLTQGRQTPWESSSLTVNFFFSEKTPAPTSAYSPKPTPTPSLSAALNPTNTPTVNLKITDKNGIVYELKNPSISYPSGFGPSRETRGIYVLQGATKGLLEWSRISKLTFKTIKEGKPNSYEVKVELRGGEILTVNPATDWNMAHPDGGTGLLFGNTALGEVNIKFSDIDTIVVLH